MASRIYVGLVVFALVGSFACLLAHLDPQPVGRPASLVTLAIGCYAAFSETAARGGSRALWGFGAVIVLGAGSEIIGLITGWPFGRYRYTERWWPTVHLPSAGNFPLQLPAAWLLVVGTSYLTLAPRCGRWTVLAVGLACTLIDQIMEPVMSGPLHYWTWIDRGPLPGGSPVQNAIGWFAISAVGAWTLQNFLRREVFASYNAAIVLAAHVTLCLGLGCVAPR